MRTKPKALLLAIIAGLCFWVLDALLSFFVFYDEPFLDLLVLNVSPHHLFIRLLAILVAVTFAFLGSWNASKREQAEDTLRFHSEIMRNMSEGVYLVRGSDGVIVYANPKFEQMFGYEPGEMVGKHVSAVNAPTEKRPEETAREIMETIRERGAWQGEINNIKKDGTPFWCYVNVSKFDHPEHGRVYVSVHIDITERKKAEEQISRQAAVLQAINDVFQKALTCETKEELGRPLLIQPAFS